MVGLTASRSAISLTLRLKVWEAGVWGTESRRRFFHVSSRPIKRSVLAASAAAAFVPLMGTGVASADTHTGYVVELTCNGVTTTYVTPTGPAAAAQDVSSTAVAVLSYGAYLVPNHFPAGKVIYCDLDNLTTGHSYQDLPFLVVGAP